MVIKPWVSPTDLPGQDHAPHFHVSFLFEARQLGGHVHVKVRAAHRIPSVQVNHSRGLCGELTMAPEEWAMFKAALEQVVPVEPCEFVDDGTTTGFRRSEIVKLAGAGGEWGADGAEVDHQEHRFIEIVEAP